MWISFVSIRLVEGQKNNYRFWLLTIFKNAVLMRDKVLELRMFLNVKILNRICTLMAIINFSKLIAWLKNYSDTWHDALCFNWHYQWGVGGVRVWGVICRTINHSSCNESTFIIFFVHIKVAATKYIRNELKV